MEERNPFTFGNPIKDPERFLGREAEVRQIVNRLLSSAHESTSLVGERRMGKTSLLNYLSNPEVASHLGLSPDKYLLVYVDFQGLTDITPQRFWQRILKKMSRLIGDRGLSPTIGQILKKEEMDLFDLEDFFEELRDKGIVTVLLLDEFEYITQNPNFRSDFFAGLRALAIHSSLAFVIATRRDLVDLAHSEEIKGSPFFNIFASVVLRPLSKSEVFDLIDKYLENTNISFSQEEKEFVYWQGGGYPTFTQMIGHYIVEGKKQDLHGAALEEFAAENFRSQADAHLTYLWSHSNESEKITALIIFMLGLQSHPPNAHPTLENITGIHPRGSMSIHSLMKRGLVIEEDDGFRLFSPCLEKWILTEYPDLSRLSDITLSSEEILDILYKRNLSTAFVRRFFRKAGFEIEGISETNLTALPTTEAMKQRAGTRIPVHIMVDRPLKAIDIQSLADHTASDDRSIKQVAFVIVGEHPDAGARAQIFVYRWEKQLVVVPFSYDRLKQAIYKDICPQEMEAILNDHLAARPDLYDLSVPVYFENFFGRLQVIEELLTYLNENQPIGIFALNKMGKTSLIGNLAERLSDRAVATIDLQSISPNIIAVYTQIVKTLKQDIQTKWRFPAEEKLVLTGDNAAIEDPMGAFAHDMNVLHRTLLNTISSPRFVIFIDEIDRLIPAEDFNRVPGFSSYNDLLTTLRGLCQQGLPLTFVVIGIQPNINRKAKLAGLENAGFHLFREMFLPPLTHVECDQMIGDIGQQMGLEYSPEALSRVYYESGGHPFLARQLCSQMWESLSSSRISGGLVRVEENDILLATEAYIDDGRRASYLEQIWETRLNDDERSIVKRLAASASPESSPKSERQAINRLMERHLVLQENGKVRLAFGLFQKWVRAFVLDIEEV